MATKETRETKAGGEHAAFNAVYGPPVRPIETPNIVVVRLVRGLARVRRWAERSFEEQQVNPQQKSKQ